MFSGEFFNFFVFPQDKECYFILNLFGKISKSPSVTPSILIYQQNEEEKTFHMTSISLNV